MVAKTKPRGTSKANDKKRTVAAPKVVRKAVAVKSSVKSKPNPSGDLQQRLFAAALEARAPGAFEVACARVVQSAMNASAAVLTLSADGVYSQFATSDVAEALVADHVENDPLRRCLCDGTEYQVCIDTARKSTKAHDAVASSLGWRNYLCMPLYNTYGAVIGAASIYFSGRVNLRQKGLGFDSQIRPALTAALCARAHVPVESIEAQQFSSLAAAIPGVVYQRIVWPDGNIRYTYLSEGAREMFGVDPEAVLKDPEVLFKTYTDDYKKTFRTRLVEASKSLTKWDVEASVIMADGSCKTTHAIARPERRTDGSTLWTGVILDASRAKEAEDGLKEANRLVGLANQAKSAFLAKMSHEMRTPLNGVLGMGDLLLKTDLTQRQMRLANTLCDSAKGLLGIINDVLDLSRIEAGHFKLDVQDFNLRHCVEDAVELCATSGYRKGLEVNLIVEPGIPVGVMSDPVRLRQVLINLIGNAVKFTENGEVVIRLKPLSVVAGGVAIDVSDTGIGIDEAAIGRLFEPFAQADASISRRFGGTGLGLSITRHLVELLGGTITMSSVRGKGTTVSVEIPFEVTAPSQAPKLAHDECLAGLRILIIDDRATNREMMALNLRDSSARVETVDNEDGALAMLASAARAGDPYRVAIVDRIRPRCGGLHLSRTIRSNPRLVDTAMVVLMSTNWNANPADQHGLTDTVFLSKPARRTDLLSAVVRAHLPDVSGVRGAGSTMSNAPWARALPPALKLRVLLVEDNATNIEVAREYLAELSCRVTVAVNGIEALTAFDRGRYDIILMDSQMPELDGLSATRRIRETERARGLGRTPLIAVTANAYESDKAQALEAGSDDFLSKPFTDMQLRAMLEKWMPRVGVDQTLIAVDAPAQVNTPASTIELAASKPMGSQLTERLDEALHAVLARSRPAFLNRLLRTFLSSMPETVATLRAAIEQADGELLKTIAHSLKSASANVGAKRLSELCRLLDVKLKLGANASDCSSLTDAIETELGLVGDALHDVLQRFPAADDVAFG